MSKVTRNLHWILFATLLIFSITLVSVGMASPAEITVAVDPPEVKDLEPDSTFAVNITVTGLVVDEEYNGLYAWDVWLKFNSRVLEVVEITEGLFLKTVFNETTWEKDLTTPIIDNDAGMIKMGNTHMPVYPIPIPGATGSGTLATVTFKVVSRGRTSLHFELSKLNTLYAGAFNTEMEHKAVDGSFDNGAGTELSIGLIAAIGAVIVCSAGVLFYMRRRRR